MPQLASVSSAVVADDLTIADLGRALLAGWRDYRTHPGFGLMFSGLCAACGAFLYLALTQRGEVGWLIYAASGYPLIAPFAAVGLYEVSRRHEAGLPLTWGAILNAARGKGDDQLLMMGSVLFVGFSFWVILAHGIFAIFLAQSGLGGESLALLATPAGQAMLAVGGTVGALVALGFYAVSVFSLPLLADRDVDFLSAIIVSLAAFRANLTVMLAWAALIALALAVAMLPLFLGLLLVLPVLGHATWHLYRRTVSFVAEDVAGAG